MGVIRKYFKPLFTVGIRFLKEGPKYRRMALHKDKYSYEERYKTVTSMMDYTTKMFNAEYRIKGLEKVPEGSVYFAVNHKSYCDPFIAPYLKQKIVPVAKKEVRNFPFVGNMAEAINTIFYDRENLRDGIRMAKEATDVLKNGLSLWVALEGTRSKKKDHSMNEFKAGALKPAFNAKATVVPLVLSGTWKILDPHCCKKHIYIDAVFLDPIPYEKYKNLSTKEFSNILYKRIKEVDDQLLAEQLKK